MLALRPAALAIVALLALPAAASAAGTWNPESYLAVGLQEASGPSIAVAANGGAVAGWQQNQPPFGNVDAVLTARAPGTAPFATGGTPQGVASAHAHDLGDMRMTTAVNASGKAVVAWVQAAFNKPFRVQAAVRAAGASSFGPVQTLTADGEDADVPAVAINDAGAAVLVWRRHDSANESWEVQGALLSAAGTQFGAPADISDEPVDGFDDPFSPPVSVAIAPDGGAVAAWESEDEHRVADARWARVGGGVHDLGAGSHFADVAAGPDGSFALTWVTGSGGTGADAWLARATTGDFGIAVPVGGIDGAFASTRVALDGAGNAIVAVLATLEDRIDAPTRAGVTSCAAACDDLQWLSADSGRAQGLDLAVDAAGDAVAAWSRSNGQKELIEASLRAHGKAWDAPVFISRTDQAAHAPTLGIDGGGNVTVAWEAANVALAAVRQTTGAVEGAAGPTDPGPTDPGPTDPGPGTTPPPPGPPADTALAVSVKQAKKLTASAKGAFKGPKVSCSEPAGGACTVTLTFKAKKLVAAAKTLTVAGGKSATPTLKLRKKAKRQLAKKGRLALKGTVVVRDAAGNARTFSVKTTLKPKKRR